MLAEHTMCNIFTVHSRILDFPLFPPIAKSSFVSSFIGMEFYRVKHGRTTGLGHSLFDYMKRGPS